MKEEAQRNGRLHDGKEQAMVHDMTEQVLGQTYKVPGTNKQIIKKFARIGEASIIYSIGRHRFIELARAAGATYKINEGTGGTVLINLEIFDNYMEQFRQPARPLKEPLYGQEEGEVNE